MPLPPDRVTEALLFTAIALVLPILLAWWLFGSRLAGTAHSSSATLPTEREATWIGGLLGLSGLQLLVGGHWDAAMHIKTGQVPGGSDFLWPPHIMIYLSFLVSLFVATFAVASLARAGWTAGNRDPRRWVRSNPYLGTVAVASAYSLLSISGDAIWHELFGIDLTAWSPPHILLMLTSVTVILSGAGMVAKVLMGHRRPLFGRLGILIMLATALQMAQLVGVTEWELGARIPLAVLERPIWLYPVVSGGLSILLFSTARSLLKLPWAATYTALADLLLRAGLAGFLLLSGNPVPRLPLVPLLGAVLLDLLLNRGGLHTVVRILTAAVGFAGGFFLLALPILSRRPELPFAPGDYLSALLVLAGVGWPLLELGSWFGQALSGRAGSGSAPGTH